MTLLRLVALLLLSACVRSHVPPEERVFPAGQYTYHARLLLPAAPESTDFRGVLDLRLVEPDSLAGRWQVPGYEPEFRESRFNVVSYELHARIGDGADSLTVIHSLKRNRSAGVPSCSVRVTRAGYIAQGRCTLGATQ